MTDNVYVVTGGTGGLGEATITELGNQGAAVVINDLPNKREEATAIADAVNAAGGSATTHLGDVSDLEYTESLIESVIDAYGRLDGIVNFAGLLRDSYLTDMSEAEWQAVISVHLTGHFGLLQSAAKHWRETAEQRDNNRSFVCVTSPSAFGNVGQANYAAAKAGVLGLMRTAATELERYGVSVNALLPIAHTAMTEEFLDPEDFPPEKIAPVAAFLATPELSDLTGCTVRAAGDNVGLVSNPELERVAFNDGGWSTAELADQVGEIFGDEANRRRTNTQL